MLKGAPRAANVLQRVADMAGYTKKRDGRAVGIAYSDALRSHTAVAAEVSVDTKSGEITVHHLWAAVDAGTAVQPKNIVAQMTSAMTFGLGAALKEQIAIKGGVMQASNFDGYPVLRMSEVPPMDVGRGLHRKPADRHRRSGRPGGRAGHRQRGGATHR
jgi:isoquinoline 1-oxidoreductase beta subunit